MAVSVRPFSASGRSNQDAASFFTTLTEEFWVDVTDPVTERHQAIYDALPQRGDPHPDFPGASMRFVSSLEQDSQLLWKATLVYSSEIGIQGPTPQDPLTWTILWEIGFQTDQEAFRKEPFTTTPPLKQVQNSAFDPFDPAPTTPKYLAVLTVTKNYTDVSLSTIRDTQNKANSGSFLGESPGNVLARSIRANGPLYQQDVLYVRVTAQFLLDANAHVVKFLDQGFNKLIPGVPTSKKTQITLGENNRPASSPVNLDGAGGIAVGDAAELAFNRFGRTSFSWFELSIDDFLGLNP